MVDHKCKYAALIGREPAWQTDENDLTVCVWCHEPKNKPIVDAVKASGSKMVSRATVAKQLPKDK